MLRVFSCAYFTLMKCEIVNIFSLFKIGLFSYYSWSYIEKRRRRKDIKVTRRKGGGVKRRQTNLASNQFPKCSPQPKEIHRVK